MNSSEALLKLINGNQRFQLGLKSVDSFFSSLKIEDLAKKGQHPSCVVFACADSRVTTEAIFDQGIGDIVVIRVAGNVITPTLLAGLEYSVKFFDVPLALVLGHTGCGAILATFNSEVKLLGGLSPDLTKLLGRIRPAMRKAMKRVPAEGQVGSADLLREATLENVRRGVRLVQRSTIISERLRDGRIQVLGAVYDIATGKVEFDFVD